MSLIIALKIQHIARKLEFDAVKSDLSGKQGQRGNKELNAIRCDGIGKQSIIETV